MSASSNPPSYFTVQGHGPQSKKILDGLKEKGFQVLQQSKYSDDKGTFIEFMLSAPSSEQLKDEYCDYAIKEISEYLRGELHPNWGIFKSGNYFILQDQCFYRLFQLFTSTNAPFTLGKNCSIPPE